MTDLLDRARDRIGRAIFATWDPTDIRELVRLMHKLAATMKEMPVPSMRSRDLSHN